MSRRIVALRTLQVVLDLMVLMAALALGFFARFEGAVPAQMLKRLVVQGPYVVALQYGLLVAFDVPRSSWRYVGLREAVRISQALATACCVLAGVRVVAAAFFRVDGYAQFAMLPFGVIAIDGTIALLFVGGIRVLRRISTERAEIRKLRQHIHTQTPTLLVGAGRGGVMVAKEIAGRPELGILPVGFIDDAPDKHGTAVHGIRVLGATNDLERIARALGVKQAIITVANAPGSVVRSISDACQRVGLQVKVIPGLFQLVGGDVNLTRIRDVAIEDLLRRDAVVLDDDALLASLQDRVVAVTGAGGSIGSEICRQICRFHPRLVLLIERTENALFEVHRDLSDNFPLIKVQPCLADVCDVGRIDELFRLHAPAIVFHAAAHKHVPMMEWNPREAIKNNALGTRLIADLAHEHRVEAFVMISTDKAINPTSVMGATKRVAELYVQALGKTSQTRFVTVRFGNVLGSNGSVVPIFKEQIARGGPVTVTHPDMTRYFMTIPEACQLVLQASVMGCGGEIFILDMGEPVKIVDLARDLIQLSGFGENEIEIRFSGMRPGEKLYEELSTLLENAEKTRHPKILIGTTQAEPLAQMEHALDDLQVTARTGHDQDLRSALKRIVPEFQTPAPKSPSLQPPHEPVISTEHVLHSAS